MKLLQAIVTSSVETLDNRQGFGLVQCSRAMPEPIRQQARNWGYSSDANGHPIFSLKHIDVSGVGWAVMNRTIPATDFTGRTSYVSHTIALRLADLQLWYKKYRGNLVSPFELMLHFPWEEAWDAKPSWIEEMEDMEIGENIGGHLFANNALEEQSPLDGRKFAYLLAFEFPENGKPSPRRSTWDAGSFNSAAILRFFHQTWITLDPWRGGRTYGEYLNEPDVSLAESWDCSFTTNLRNERPDPYQWVVLTGGSSRLGNRGNIDLNEWRNLDEKVVLREIGERYGCLLVERSKEPTVWAQKEIQKLMERHINEQREEFSHSVRKIEEQVDEIIHGVEDYFLENKKDYRSREGQLSNQGHGTKEIEEIDDYIKQSKNQIDKAIYDLESNHVESSKKLIAAIAPIQEILSSQTAQDFTDQSNPLPLPPDLSGKRKDFDAMADKVRLSYLYVSALKRESYLIEEKHVQAASVAKIERGREKLNIEIEGLRAKDRTSAGEIARLKTTASSRRQQPAWQFPILIGASVLALALGVYVFIKKDVLFNDNPQPNKLLSETADKLKKMERDVGSQKSSIDTLEAEKSQKQAELKNQKASNEKLEREISDLNKNNNKLDDELKAKDQELDKIKKELNAKTAVVTDAKKGEHAEVDTKKDKKTGDPPSPKPATPQPPLVSTPKVESLDNDKKQGLPAKISDR